MHKRPTAIELAKVPLTDRGIGWQADATAVLKEQAAEIAALRKDAERYRWLKTRKRLDLRSGYGEWQRMDGTKFTASHYLAEGDTQHAPAESLDETIDAAMLVRRIGAA